MERIAETTVDGLDMGDMIQVTYDLVNAGLRDMDDDSLIDEFKESCTLEGEMPFELTDYSWPSNLFVERGYIGR